MYMYVGGGWIVRVQAAGLACDFEFYDHGVTTMGGALDGELGRRPLLNPRGPFRAPQNAP